MNAQYAFSTRFLKLALATAAGFCGFIQASHAAVATGSSTATVIVPITIVSDSAIAFGKFTKAAGTITMTPAGGRSATGGVTSLSTVTPGAAGQVTVSGEASATYSIVVANGTLTGPGAAMTLENIKVAASDATGDLITAGLIGAGGSQVLKTGGDLTVAADQVSGAYTGSYSVTVEYN
jgi:hypothetical protein